MFCCHLQGCLPSVHAVRGQWPLTGTGADWQHRVVSNQAVLNTAARAKLALGYTLKCLYASVRAKCIPSADRSEPSTQTGPEPETSPRTHVRYSLWPDGEYTRGQEQPSGVYWGKSRPNTGPRLTGPARHHCCVWVCVCVWKEWGAEPVACGLALQFVGQKRWWEVWAGKTLWSLFLSPLIM